MVFLTFDNVGAGHRRSLRIWSPLPQARTGVQAGFAGPELLRRSTDVPGIPKAGGGGTDGSSGPSILRRVCSRSVEAVDMDLSEAGCAKQGKPAVRWSLTSRAHRSADLLHPSIGSSEPGEFHICDHQFSCHGRPLLRSLRDSGSTTAARSRQLRQAAWVLPTGGSCCPCSRSSVSSPATEGTARQRLQRSGGAGSGLSHRQGG